jgi:hypothetical protein
MRTPTAVAAAVVVVGIVGCRSFDPEAVEANLEAPNFHEFVQALDTGYIKRAGEVRLVEGAENRAKGDIDGTLHQRVICFLPESKDLVDGIERYCANAGGRIALGVLAKEKVQQASGVWLTESRQYTWCERPADSRPLFGYAVSPVNRSCRLIKYLVADGPEPTDRFVKFADELGHRTPQAREIDRAVAESAARSRQRQDQMRADDRSRLAKINIAQFGRRGAAACRIQGSFRYEAIVEEVAGEQLRVYVQRAYVPSQPHLSPGGFSPHIEWVHAADWFDCTAWR